MWKFIKMLVGISLLPFCWAVSLAVYQLYSSSINTALDSGWEAGALPLGFLLWALVFFLMPRPTRTYVLGHELTHAIWALMMGGRVGKMKVGRSGGHVMLSKTNFAITLAPYFFPFYTFLVIGAYYLTGLTVDVESYRAWWMGAVGFTWSFHVTFTIHMLSQNQPDIEEHGRIFSFTVIYIMNLLVIGVWMVLVGAPRLANYGNLIWQESALAYGVAHGYILIGWTHMAGLLETMRGGGTP
ncbi:hypothetical protein PDESU_02715 [Pontiella desulfatans]|uniref:Uncharacterized protein n=1 Tax=Pontiella desulfatans TaxID=2750659 RepID=A0A6C2U439_PONDE|nr:hypothetical protein [Pontiella desulfatans]VGO14156.1 hypothetical protein PDESU_02715 [Pontiella desulfatans]